MVSVLKLPLTKLAQVNFLNLSKLSLTCCNFCGDAGQNGVGTTVAARRLENNGFDNAIKKINIKTVLNTGQADDLVRVQGWVRGFRKQKEIIFLEINDGSSFHRLHIVLPANKKPKDLNIHSSVDVTGLLVMSPKNPAVLELHPTSEMLVLGPCDQKLYPFAGKVTYTQDYIRQYLHLRPKTNKFSSMLRLRSDTTRAIHDFFHKQDFIQIHTPIITSNDCEGAGESFTVRPGSEYLIKQMSKEAVDAKSEVKHNPDEVFFNRKAHLTVSGQLHLEAAASGLEKVWNFSPVFRAENQQSTRHLSEFYMVEAELAFAYEIEEILQVMEDLVKFCMRRILTDSLHDWEFQTKDDVNLRGLLNNILKHPFTVMTFDEAKHLLLTKADSLVQDGKGLSREQELILVERLNSGIPVFVIDWPGNIKPFYMRECDYDSSKVSAVDLLVPMVGELCGGSLRESNQTKLEARITSLDSSGALKESLSWYLELRKFGGVPSGGFGLGFDRLMQLITGAGNIKDVSPFPRWAHNCPM